jgi:hypothetical protein
VSCSGVSVGWRRCVQKSASWHGVGGASDQGLLLRWDADQETNTARAGFRALLESGVLSCLRSYTLTMDRETSLLLAKHCPLLTLVSRPPSVASAVMLSSLRHLLSATVLRVHDVVLPGESRLLGLLHLTALYETGQVDLDAVMERCPRLVALDFHPSDGVAMPACAVSAQLTRLRCTARVVMVQSVADRCARLEDLTLHDSRVLSYSLLLAVARGTPLLKRLQLSHVVPAMSCEEGATLFASWPRLQQLDLDPSMPSFSWLAEVGRCCPDLWSLRLRLCALGMLELPALLAECGAGLRLLHVRGYFGTIATDSVMIAIAENCSGSRLHTLGLTGCLDQQGVTGLSAVLESCTDISSLDLSSTKGLTDAALFAVGQHCDRLHSLNVSGCYAVSDAGVQCVVEGCALLSKLELRGCDNVSAAACEALLLGCPALYELRADEDVLSGRVRQLRPAVHV